MRISTMSQSQIIIKVLIIIGTMVTLFNVGSACRCRILGHEESYCRSDFVLKVRVGKKLQPNPDTVYSIEIEEQWKFNFANMVENKTQVHTGFVGCFGVGFGEQTSYLISGSVDKTARQMRVDVCTSIIALVPLSVEALSLKTNPPICA